eukprot:TRINITY_DN1477_c0_g1_i1.p1 TRINITY_DN1477_c0_g1~~TRINITY_DN1477_c0_g1_i1.p1  ORF type:complete len:226 (-),score=78.01 TRINITY_DN1477_c0_g1_i1:123-800(-)
MCIRDRYQRRVHGDNLKDSKIMQGRQELAIRKPAPVFDGVAYFKGEFKNINLTQYAGKYVVLFFYPLDFTFVCPTEIIQFATKAAEFRANNCEVIGCSIDSHFSHMEYCKKSRADGGLGDIDIPLLADVTKSIGLAYNTIIPEEGIAFRSTYIIDGKGILRHISMNDTPVGRNVDEVLRLVQAFQYTDEYGEVCPASWRKGDKTMKTDHNDTKTKTYFQEVHAKQ